MNHILPILMAVQALILTAGCSGRGQVTLNAPGLEGIGAIALGRTTEESLASVKMVEDKPFNLYINTDMRLCDGRYVEKDVKYALHSGDSLDMRLCFFRDTLVVMRVYGRWKSGSAEKAARELRSIYGHGLVKGNAKRSGRIEMWRSADATAVYFLQDNGKTGSRQRAILEFMEFFPTKRDIRSELAEYDKAIAAAAAEAENDKEK